MNFFKKMTMTGVGVALSLVLVACGGGTNGSNSSSANNSGVTPHKLTIAVVATDQTKKQTAAVKTTAKKLSKKLAMPVKTKFVKNSKTLLQDLKQKKVDVGFFPAADLNLANAASKGVQRYNYDRDSDSETTGKATTYRSVVLVKNDATMTSLSDLQDKTIATAAKSSAAQYIWPAASLKQKGLDLATDAKTMQTSSAKSMLSKVISGKADAALLYEGQLQKLIASNSKLLEQVTPLTYTKKVPNSNLAMRSDLSRKFENKFAKAFIKVAKSKSGNQALSRIYDNEGFMTASSANLKAVRNWEKAAAKR
jgi:phosphonate transport system substrate-binding protein